MPSKPFASAAVVLAVAVLLYPLVVDNAYYVHLLETMMIYAILLFGLDIVVGYTGEVSLGHAALLGIGSYTAGVLVLKFDAPIWLTIPAAIATTAVFGAILALPALRVTGPYLAMVTLAFGTILQILINEMSFLTEGPLGIKLTKPTLFGHKLGGTAFFYLVSISLALALFAVHRILKSHFGRALTALRGSPVACDCMGVSVYKYKVIGFVISAGLAGWAGALYAYSEEYISPNSYNFDLTILFVLAVIIGGRRTRTGSMLGAVIVVLLPSLLSDLKLFRIIACVGALIAAATGAALVARGRKTTREVAVPVLATAGMAGASFYLRNITDWRLTIFGLMTLFVVYYVQDGIIGFARDMIERVRPDLVHRHAVYQGEKTDEARAFAPSERVPAVSGDLVTVDQVVMQFGGLKALNKVDLRVARGTIHALIGPNGSGKSTMINVLTGIYPPTAGSARLGASLISGKKPSQIARAGVARTFQNLQLFGEMTAVENVLVGLHHTYKSNLVDVVLGTARYRSEERSARLRALSLLDFVRLDGVHNEEARNLPYGKQRLLEIARALAIDPDLILLDEPAAGMTSLAIQDLTTIIEKIRDHGITVLMVEHHMDLVMKISDTVTVLDFGQKIAEGEPAAVRADPKVVAAYLGGEEPVEREVPAP